MNVPLGLRELNRASRQVDSVCVLEENPEIAVDGLDL
jgi:hypothetical protein